jgi:DNA-binding IclR family transcriptional regulator
VHRLLQVLVRRGMVARDASQRGYTLGYRVLALAQAVQGEATLREICRAPMQWLRSVTEETVGLYVVAGDVRMCLDELESPRMLRMAAGVGRCFPLDRGSASRALLADGQASADTWHRATALLPADRREWLLGEVEQLRVRGYAMSSGETVPGSASIAAPIRDSDGGVLAAISVGGPSSRFNEETIPSYVRALLEAVDRIRRDLEAAHALPAMSAR